ncbi:MAG: 16S rRNA (uracil(1498)-N(3))-methyltransferase [Planctomycetes bacterium]|nr:16S rRNA (uracil(1498)-N(3))-methyltransferase [Planctomycetota bacterium]
MRTLLVPAPLAPGPIDLSEEEAYHGRSVLRLRVGDEVRIADGAGRAGLAVVRADRRTLTVETIGPIEQLAPDPAAHLTVACAPPKGDRFADLVRGLTELGVGRILPLACARGERLPNDTQLERLRRIAAEALKQCRRSHLPELGPLAEIATLAQSGSGLTFLDRDAPPARPGPLCPTVLVIGPEGGFSPEERQMLVAAGANAARLAGPVLRIETAALAAAAVWATAWEEHRP